MIPDIRQADMLAVEEVLKSGMLVQGKHVAELESLFCEFTNAGFSRACSNGTSTMHMALMALGGIGPGDEVIVPAFSYVATANVVELVGATPIFVDIELTSYNIDVSKIEEKITSRTKAIIPVHEFGNPCEIMPLMSIAQEHDLFVIEDAACALGARVDGQHVGTFGDFGSFSFHPRKAITGGEGGMLIMNDESLVERISVLRNHGINDSNGEFEEAGFNYRMTDMQAALIKSQFPRLEQQLEHRRSLVNLYKERLREFDILLPNERANTSHAWQSFHVLLNGSTDRNRLIQKLRDDGVGSNYGAQCIPEVKYYRNKYKLDLHKECPNASLAFNKGLVLPLYMSMSSEDAQYVVDCFIKNCLKND